MQNGGPPGGQLRPFDDPTPFLNRARSAQVSRDMLERWEREESDMHDEVLNIVRGCLVRVLMDEDHLRNYQVGRVEGLKTIPQSYTFGSNTKSRRELVLDFDSPQNSFQMSTVSNTQLTWAELNSWLQTPRRMEEGREVVFSQLDRCAEHLMKINADEAAAEAAETGIEIEPDGPPALYSGRPMNAPPMPPAPQMLPMPHNPPAPHMPTPHFSDPMGRGRERNYPQRDPLHPPTHVHQIALPLPPAPDAPPPPSPIHDMEINQSHSTSASTGEEGEEEWEDDWDEEGGEGEFSGSEEDPEPECPVLLQKKSDLEAEILALEAQLAEKKQLPLKRYPPKHKFRRMEPDELMKLQSEIEAYTGAVSRRTTELIMCLICQERPKAVIFLPCKCEAICVVCSEADLSHCPNCRLEITDKFTPRR